MRFISNLVTVSFLSIFMNLVTAINMRNRVGELIKEDLQERLEAVTKEGGEALTTTSDKLKSTLGAASSDETANAEQAE